MRAARSSGVSACVSRVSSWSGVATISTTGSGMVVAGTVVVSKVSGGAVVRGVVLVD